MEFSNLLHVLISNWELVALFFLIAVLYSSVGFGGGSSYLAVLALSSLAFTEIRAAALLCNIVVVTGSSFIYLKNNLFDWKKIAPLVFMSVPLAFLGGYLRIGQTVFFVLLGLTLLTAALLMWTSKYITKKSGEVQFRKSLKRELSYGGGVGFISGMVGIGGGIFLSPLLHLTKWDTPKRIAATSSFFILVNSMAGLGGQLFNPEFSIAKEITIILMIIVFIGGQIGSRMSVQLISPFALKRATAVLIAFVALRILWKHLL